MSGASHFRIAAVVLGALLSSSCDAAAYIDPGSSSYLFQLLIGGLTAVAFFFGSIRRRLKAGYQRLFLRRRNHADELPLPTKKVASNDA